MTTSDFVTEFAEEVARRRQRGPRTPTGIAQQWDEFVDLVVAGYDDNIYEFENELSVRGLIADLLSDPAILAHAESGWFVEAIDRVDNKLRTAMTSQPVRDHGKPWWRSHLPKAAGAELASDLHSLYGYDVERIV